jgi:hypothetical protein
MNKNNEGDLRVWHIPQVPGKPFIVPVPNPEVAIIILNILWDYDNFQYEENIKDDYSNVSGLEVFEDGEWCDWYSDDGEDISEYMDRLSESVI